MDLSPSPRAAGLVGPVGGSRVVVTGGASGLGASLVAARGDRVLACDVAYDRDASGDTLHLDVAGLDEWQWILDINLLGVVRGTRPFVPLSKRRLERQRPGRIVGLDAMGEASER